MKTYHIEHTPMKILLEPHYFDYRGETLKIPEGFCFDGTSVPRLLSFVVIPNDTDTLIAGLEHDFLYSQVSGNVHRREADIHFMGQLPTIFTRLFAYIGVRLGGWYSFKKDRNYKKYKNVITVYRETLIHTPLGTY